jgi:glucose-1-phosphate thymidylyltransferase
MKGILLCGGTGSRLHPLTKVTNKHLLPIGNKQMVLHSVEKLVEAGVTDIMIITGTEHMGDMISLLGSGAEYGCGFTFRVQDQPDGIGGALKLCEAFVGADNCIVILGDNIFRASLKDPLANFVENNKSCQLFLKKVPDPQRYGVAILNGESVVQIEEKPLNPKSDYAITGIYIYNSEVFDILRTLKPSSRGEYEITDVNNAYIKQGTMSYTILDGWWTDAGTHPSYHKANVLMRELMREER